MSDASIQAALLRHLHKSGYLPGARNPFAPGPLRGTPSAPPPASPAEAAPVDPTPVPFDPMSDANYVAADAANTQNNKDLFGSLGVTVNPDGTITYGGGSYLSEAQQTGVDENGSFITDPNDVRYNPFSAQAQLKAHYAQAQSQTSQSLANQGQVHSGAYQNALDPNSGYLAKENTQSTDSLIRRAQDYYRELTNRATTARNTGISNLGSAAADALTRHVAAHANDPAPVVPQQVPVATGGKPQRVTGPRRAPTLGPKGANLPGRGY